MEMWFIFALCFVSITSCCALPTETTNYASDASQIIATNLLKSYVDIDGNQVHSPLGVAVELAVLAEGAHGATYDEFSTVFGYPKERSSLRESFKRILANYQGRDYGTVPSFQTWLYIYRNYSARAEFKEIVRDHYFVEVKDINRDDYDWSEPNTSLDLEEGSTSAAAALNSKDVIGFETLKHLNIDDDDDDIGIATLKDAYGEEVLEKETSKFDRVVDDKQYVEKPVILAEIKREQAQQQPVTQKESVELKKEKLCTPNADIAAKQEVLEIQNSARSLECAEAAQEKELTKREDLVEDSKREDDLNLEENETVSEVEKLHKNYNELQKSDKIIVPIQEVLDSNEPEKVSIPLQKMESAMQSASKDAGEVMLALESHLSSVRRVFGARSLFNKDDITSALSANSITGREIGSKTKMLLFNGLYYRGNWANAFQELRDADEQFFFMTSEDAMKTPMMHARGAYYMADLPHLNAKAICLPYENNKYNMLLIVPNDIEGLHDLIDNLQPSDLKSMKTLAKPKQLHVILPKFQVEETSRSESMLKSLGLRKLFSRDEADLSLLADDQDVHVDEIVQFVNIRVDEGGSSKHALSAINTEGRTAASEETFEINRPFLYFVMDCEEQFVIVSGKIYTPEFKDEQPISIHVEFEQA